MVTTADELPRSSPWVATR